MQCLLKWYWLLPAAITLASAQFLKVEHFGTEDDYTSEEDNGNDWREHFRPQVTSDGAAPDVQSGRDKNDQVVVPDNAIYFPHEIYCRLFYLFDGRQVVILSCPKGQRFDDKKMKCLKSKQVKCGKRKELKKSGSSGSSEEYERYALWLGYKCPKSNGNFPHEHYCHFFYNCKDNNPNIMMCPQGMLFDIYQSECRRGSRVSCEKRQKPEGFDEDYNSVEEIEVTTPADEKLTCPSSMGIFPHPTDCTKFLRCWFSLLDVGTCPYGLLFDQDIKLCLGQKYVNCRGRKSPYDIEKDSEDVVVDENPDFYCNSVKGRFPHVDCSMYYECRDAMAKLLQCPKGKMYDAEKEKCMDSTAVDCTRNITKEEITNDDVNFLCPTREGKFSHEENCGAYYVCSKGQAKQHNCEEGQLYDTHSRKCEDEEEVTCGDRIHPNDDPEEHQDEVIDPHPNYECERRHGRFTHDSYCNWYYNCRDNKPSVRECKKGKYYETRKHQCFETWEVNCEDRTEPEDVGVTEEPEFECPYKSGKFPHERDCGAFYECKNYKHKVYHCPKNKLYDSKRRSCEDEDHVTCGDRIYPDDDPDEPQDKIIDSNPKFDCKKSFGKYFHKDFCDWYYNCHDKKATLRECRSGRLFDSYRNKCFSWWEVICDDRKKPEDLKTTAAPKTTTKATTTAPTTTTRRITTEKFVTKYPDFVCPSKDGKYPHELYCESYYECKKGQFKIHYCNKGSGTKLFDSKKRKCEDEDNVKCDDRLHPNDDPDEPEDKVVDPNPKFKCEDAHGRFTHNSYCHWYYRCHDGQSSIRECPKGKYYDKKKRKCVDSWEVKCEKRKEPDEDIRPPTTTERTTTEKEIIVTRPYTFVCPHKEGKYPHETNCGDFYECKKGQFKIHSCPKDKLFDIKKEKCERDDRVTCGDRLHPDDDPDEPEDKIVDPNPKFDCKEPHGRFTHDSYCHWYYRCHDSKSSVRECRKGRYYDWKKRKCIDSKEVDCEDRRKPEEDITTTTKATRPPTTTEQITTERETFTTAEATRLPTTTEQTTTIKEERTTPETRPPTTTTVQIVTKTTTARPIPTTTEPTTKRDTSDDYDCDGRTGRFSHEYCDRYYECRSGESKLMVCNDGEYYDEGRQDCVEWWMVICGDRKDPKDIPDIFTSGMPEIASTVSTREPTTKKVTEEPRIIVCPEQEGVFPDKKNCGKYYLCKDGIGEAKLCPEGQLYDIGLEKCAKDNDVICGERIHPNDHPDLPQDKIIDPDPDFDCTESHGCYTHEMFCKWYYHCHDKRPTVRECSNGTYFDSNRFKCLEWWMVFCDKRIVDDPTTIITTAFTKATTTPYREISTKQDSTTIKIPERTRSPEPNITPTGPGKQTTINPEGTKTARPDRTRSQEPDITPTDPGRQTTPNPEGTKTPRPDRTRSQEPDITPTGPGRQTTPNPEGTKTSRPDRTRSQEPDITPTGPGRQTTPNPEGTKTPRPDRTRSQEPDITPTGPGRQTTPGPVVETTSSKTKPIVTPTVPGRTTTDRYGTSIPITVSSISSLCDEEDGLFPHDRDCSLFYKCKNGSVSLHKCPKGSLFDTVIKLCYDEDRVECGIRERPETWTEEPITTEEPIGNLCELEDGDFHDPTDCRKYYTCKDGEYVEHICSEGTLFDDVMRICFDEDQVDCKSRFRPPTTTAEPETDDPCDHTTEHHTTTTPGIFTPIVTPRDPNTTSDPEGSSDFPTGSSEATKSTEFGGGDETTTSPVSGGGDETTASPGSVGGDETTTSPGSGGGDETTTSPGTEGGDETTTSPGSGEVESTTSPATVGQVTGSTTVKTGESDETTISSLGTDIVTNPNLDTTTVDPCINHTHHHRTTTHKPTGPPDTGCPSSDLDCIIDKTGDPSEWFKCPTRFGRFPHGSSKRLFISCNNWKPHVKKCGGKKIFFPEFHGCD